MAQHIVRGQLVLVVSLALAWIGPAGCSDDDEKTDAAVDAGIDGAADLALDVGPELAVPDSTPDLGIGNMGAGCTKNAECTGSGAVCLTINKTLGAGLCSMSCTPDDTKTPLINEDNCPTSFVCAGIDMTSGSKAYYCLGECVPSFTKNPCDATSKTTCHPTSSRFIGPNKAVCFYVACQTNQDCPVFSATTCVKDTDCTSLASDAFCSDSFCARPGNCTAGGLCGTHKGIGKTTAKVGDACKDDFDCPENGRCLFEDKTNTGGFGVGYRNGYCVVRYCMFPKQLPEFACPAEAVCNYLYYGGYCFKSCKLSDASTCRGNAADQGGDYECYDWTGWTTSGVKAATGPMCLDATTQECDSLGTSECSSIGDSSNSTNMSCRDRFTGQAKSNKKDPNGICLDNTASGTFATSGPDAGAPDAGAADAAAD